MREIFVAPFFDLFLLVLYTDPIQNALFTIN